MDNLYKTLDNISTDLYDSPFSSLSLLGKETVLRAAKNQGVDIKDFERPIKEAINDRERRLEEIRMRSKISKLESDLDIALAENRDLWEENEELKIQLYNLGRENG